MSQKPTLLKTSLTKNPKPKKILFIADSKTSQVFEGLNNSLAHSEEELWTCKDTCEQLDFVGTV